MAQHGIEPALTPFFNAKCALINMNTEFISCFPVLLGVVTALIAFIMSIRLKKHDSASLIFFSVL